MILIGYLIYTLATSHALVVPVASVAIAETADIIVTPVAIHATRLGLERLEHRGGGY